MAHSTYLCVNIKIVEPNDPESKMINIDLIGKAVDVAKVHKEISKLENSKIEKIVNIPEKSFTSLQGRIGLKQFEWKSRFPDLKTMFNKKRSHITLNGLEDSVTRAASEINEIINLFADISERVPIEVSSRVDFNISIPEKSFTSLQGRIGLKQFEWKSRFPDLTSMFNKKQSNITFNGLESSVAKAASEVNEIINLFEDISERVPIELISREYFNMNNSEYRELCEWHWKIIFKMIHDGGFFMEITGPKKYIAKAATDFKKLYSTFNENLEHQILRS